LNYELKNIVDKYIIPTKTELKMPLVYSITARIVRLTLHNLFKNLLLKTEGSEELKANTFPFSKFDKKTIPELLKSGDIQAYIKSKKEFIQQHFLTSFSTSSTVAVDNENDYININEKTDSLCDSSSMLLQNYVSKYSWKGAPKRPLLDLSLDFSQQEGQGNNLNVVIGESSNSI